MRGFIMNGVAHKAMQSFTFLVALCDDESGNEQQYWLLINVWRLLFKSLSFLLWLHWSVCDNLNDVIYNRHSLGAVWSSGGYYILSTTTAYTTSSINNITQTTSKPEEEENGHHTEFSTTTQFRTTLPIWMRCCKMQKPSLLKAVGYSQYW